MNATMNKLHALLLLCSAATSCTAAVAAVVLADPRSKTAPPRHAPLPRNAPTVAPGTGSTAAPPATTRFRIRRTRSRDLDDISTMLAAESVPAKDGTSNWNVNLQRLRAKSALGKQLSQRLAAIEEGRRTAVRVREDRAMLENDDACPLTDDDACRLLWANDQFRSKLKSAVSVSQETSAWTSHNLDLTPRPDMFHHAMMSVEDVSSGEIAGFCEVAWLPSPAVSEEDATELRIRVSDDSLDVPESCCDETSDSFCDAVTIDPPPRPREGGASVRFAPAIANLVTSPRHRRRGVASRALRFASRYARTQWSSRGGGDDDAPTTLGLYVRPENEGAIRLYRKKGFATVSSGDDGLWYMRQER